MRLDKWLWAARFFKTRSLASTAIDGGKVKLNGHNAKPAKELKLGDRLQIRTGEQLWEVVVQGFAEQRRPAPEAQLLYAETPESAAARAASREQRQIAPSPGAESKGRPTKRDRRQIDEWRR